MQNILKNCAESSNYYGNLRKVDIYKFTSKTIRMPIKLFV